MKAIFKLVGIVFITITISKATIINVPADTNSIQGGINLAIDGDTVLVQPGTYIENINFNGKNIVVGSLTLTTGDTTYISQTVIDGDSSGSVVTFESGEDSTAMLIGFTITNGLGSGIYPTIGGGITCKNVNITLANLIIEDNYSNSVGAGINCYYSNITLQHSIIRRNTGEFMGGLIPSGGGMYLLHSDANLVDVVITENYAGIGGGIFCYQSSPTLIEVTIKNNSAGSGGGVYCRDYSSPTLINVEVIGNTATAYSHGGGIHCEYFSSPIMTNVIIRDNTTEGHGGGFYFFQFCKPVFNNVSIIGNTAAWSGGGIFCSDSPSLVNVTISGNTAGWDGGGIYCINADPTLVNTILWNNSPEEIYFDAFSFWPSTITITYSDVQGGEAGIMTNDSGTVNWLEGNIDTDPLFVDPENSDYDLQEGSPCIDAGTVFYIWEGDTLIDFPDTAYVGDAPDMGAFEYGAISVIDNLISTPSEFSLHQNYPNPFNPKTTIRFGLPEAQQVKLVVYNLLGKEVITLLDNELKEAGYYEVVWDAGRFSSGVYFYRIKAGKWSKTRKMVVIK